MASAKISYFWVTICINRIWMFDALFRMACIFIGWNWHSYCINYNNLIFYMFEKKKYEELDPKTESLLEVQNRLHFTVSLLGSFSLLLVTLIPILSSRKLLTVIVTVFFGVMSVFSLFVELIENCCYPDKRVDHFKIFAVRFVAFAISCLSLLIIPATQNFAELMKGFYANRWNCIVGYLGITLIFPIVTTFFMIKTGFPGVCDKYKKAKSKINWYCYVELVDIIRQISYALVAAYDLPIICICIEIAWFLLILISRPYSNVSDYSLSFGNSLVILMSNGAFFLANY